MSVTKMRSEPSVNRLNGKKFLIKHRSKIDLPLKTPTNSMPSPAQINQHYKDFQQALYMLKVSVEELWRLELDQLDKFQTKPVKPSNPLFDLQVPSIYSCRPVLPISSQTMQTHPKQRSAVNIPILSYSTPVSGETLSREPSQTKSTPKIDQSMTSPLLNRPKPFQSHFSISTKSKQRGSGDNFTKYCTKKAFLHLKFRCSKHMH